MRTRLTLLLVAIAALAAFAAFNWGEFVRPAQLSWGFGTGEAPLGLVLLALLAVSWVAFLLVSAYLETHYQLATHRNLKALEAQRLLADKAEASRFTELRAYLESQATLVAQRDVASASRVEQAVRRELAEIRALLERQTGAHATTAYVPSATHAGVLQPEVQVVRSPH